MQHELGCWRTGSLWAGLLTTGLLMTALGCQGKRVSIIAALSAEGRDTSAKLADKGADAIAAVCSRQSYATASMGLIAGETGLREDVFEMRDPMSYRVIPYRLEETVKLEGLLRQRAGGAGLPEDQKQCIGEFADHLKELSDPLIEAAKDQKEVEALAFKDTEKETQQDGETEVPVKSKP